MDSHAASSGGWSDSTQPRNPTRLARPSVTRERSFINNMSSQIPSGIFAFLDQIPGGAAVTAVNIAIAGISAAAAIYSAHAARVSISRPRPIMEIMARQNEPWDGWAVIRATIRNPAPSAMIIEEIRTGCLDRARIEMLQRLEVDRPTTTRSYVTSEYRTTNRRVLPQSAPDTPGAAAAISDLGIRIAAGSANPSRIEIACVPAANGTICLPRKLLFCYRWLDQRDRRMIHKATI